MAELGWGGRLKSKRQGAKVCGTLPAMICSLVVCSTRRITHPCGCFVSFNISSALLCAMVCGTLLRDGFLTQSLCSTLVQSCITQAECGMTQLARGLRWLCAEHHWCGLLHYYLLVACRTLSFGQCPLPAVFLTLLVCCGTLVECKALLVFSADCVLYSSG